MDEYLEHHGVKNMKWGVWNAETRARYLGLARSKVGSGAKKLKKEVGQRVETAKKEHDKKVEFRKREAQARKVIRTKEKEEQKRTRIEDKAYAKAIRKQYHLSPTKYKKLKETTLRSNNPEVVKKGMHLLNDRELDDKIDRLQREAKITDLANKQERKAAEAKRAKREAMEKTLGYKMAKLAGETAIRRVDQDLLRPITGEFKKSLMAEVKKGADKSKEEKESKKESKKEQRKEQSEQQKESSPKQNSEEQTRPQTIKRQQNKNTFNNINSGYKRLYEGNQVREASNNKKRK